MNDNDKTVIGTKYGKIEGEYRDGLYVFKGIPYAAAPIGELRWLPPQPMEPWTDIRPAREFGPIAPQNPGGIEFLQDNTVEERQNEDCLYLNIWSPAPDKSGRPVMVWIHGGAFNRGSGSNPSYSRGVLAKRGNVVLVTINYRLGPLGFLRLKDITGGKIPATGSEGLLDQIAALQWVHDNIAFFGGDPANVTVFGESAGAMSIGCLLAMPSARGLFHKAILQSGSNTVKFLDEAVKLSEDYLNILGINASDVKALKSLTAQQLLSAQNDLSVKLNIKGSVMEPVVDGELLPEMPIEAAKHNSAKGVTLLIGTNLEEAKFMAWMAPGMTRVDQAGLVKRWQEVLPPELVADLVENCRKALDKVGRDSSPSELAVALQTDRQFRIPALRLAEAHSNNNQPVFSYLFDWKSAVAKLGACHALDVGFVFGSLSPNFHCTGPEAENLATKIQDAWIAFARTGDPSCESLGKWPLYSSHRETMILGENCHVEEAPYDDERRAWEPVPNKYLG